MKTTYLKTILVMALCLAFSMEGRAVNVRLTTDKPRTVGVNNAERNLAQLLTAIDAAHRTRSNVSTRNIAMNDFAKTITELGENVKLGDLRCKTN